jgi:hypothetical protein
MIEEMNGHTAHLAWIELTTLSGEAFYSSGRKRLVEDRPACEQHVKTAIEVARIRPGLLYLVETESHGREDENYRISEVRISTIRGPKIDQKYVTMAEAQKKLVQTANEFTWVWASYKHGDYYTATKQLIKDGFIGTIISVWSYNANKSLIDILKEEAAIRGDKMEIKDEKSPSN